jgi:pimeloyl-ACP methyl ester carboxylesterase
MTLEHIVRSPAKRTRKTPLLLQHGAWHGAWCWENWLTYFADLGYEVHALSLPGHGQSQLAKRHISLYTLRDYVNCLAAVANTITPRPVVIGHSLGGAIVQKYLEQYIAPAGVLLASLPTCGILPLIWRQLRAQPGPTLKVLLTTNTTHWLKTPAQAQNLFFSPAAGVNINQWHAQLVPESFAAALRVMVPFAHPGRVKTPLLVLAGEKDAVFTVAEEQATAQAYGTTAHVFAGQAHNLMAEPEWEKVANHIDQWLTQKLKLP